MKTFSRYIAEDIKYIYQYHPFGPIELYGLDHKEGYQKELDADLESIFGMNYQEFSKLNKNTWYYNGGTYTGNNGTANIPLGSDIVYKNNSTKSNRSRRVPALFRIQSNRFLEFIQLCDSVNHHGGCVLVSLRANFKHKVLKSWTHNECVDIWDISKELEGLLVSTQKEKVTYDLSLDCFIKFCKEKSGKITDVVSPFESYLKSFNAKRYVKNYI